MQEQIFLKNAKQIKKSLNLSTEQYLEIFGMTKKEADSSFSKDFPLMKAMNFCEYFQLDIVSMFSPDFDVMAFARNYYGSSINLPERYTLDKNSRAVTLINFVNTLKKFGFDWLNDLILRRLQIPRQLLYVPEREISFMLILDFLEIVEQFQINLDIMRLAGQQGVTNLNSSFHFTDNLSFGVNKKNIESFHEEFFKSHVTKFDKSYDYKIQYLKKEFLVLKCSPKENLKELYKRSRFSNNALLYYKLGVASGVSSLLRQDLSSRVYTVADKVGHDWIGIDFSMQLNPLIEKTTRRKI